MSDQASEERSSMLAAAGSGTPKPKSRRSAVTLRLIIWFFCGVLFALAPIFIDWARQNHDGDVSLISILGNGEQFVIGSVMCLGAAAEIFATEVRGENRMLAGLLAIFVAIGNLIIYAFTPPSNELLDFTLALGVCSLITSAWCIGMAAGR